METPSSRKPLRLGIDPPRLELDQTSKRRPRAQHELRPWAFSSPRRASGRVAGPKRRGQSRITPKPPRPSLAPLHTTRTTPLPTCLLRSGCVSHPFRTSSTPERGHPCVSSATNASTSSFVGSSTPPFPLPLPKKPLPPYSSSEPLPGVSAPSSSVTSSRVGGEGGGVIDRSEYLLSTSSLEAGGL